MTVPVEHKLLLESEQTLYVKLSVPAALAVGKKARARVLQPDADATAFGVYVMMPVAASTLVVPEAGVEVTATVALSIPS